MSNWQHVRRLLCVRLDSIGDVLMTSPAIRAFRDTLGCHVTLLTSSAGAAAARLVPEIDELVEFAAPWMKAGGAAAAMNGNTTTNTADRNWIEKRLMLMDRCGR